MRPGLIPRLLSETWSHSQPAVREHGLIPRLLSGDKSMICDILWLWSEGRGSLVPIGHVGGEKSVFTRLKDVHMYLKNANSLKSFQLKSVKWYPSREKARMALGPTHTEPSIRGVKCTPKNGKRGSGT